MTYMTVFIVCSDGAGDDNDDCVHYMFILALRDAFFQVQNIHPRTGHEGPEGGRAIALLFP